MTSASNADACCTAAFQKALFLECLDLFYFYLILTDDWQFQRGSYSYFLGDPIHFEVSAIIGHHMPLRVYVDHCVATATPDAEGILKYDFIEHYG